MKTNHGTGTDPTILVFVIAMIVVVVAVDFIFFRYNFGRRLVANVIIVLMFLIFYAVFLRHH